jgi:cytochrome c oxidase subunit 1
MFLLGEDGMPRRISRYPQHAEWATLNRIETVGSVVIALGVATFLVNVWVSLRDRKPAGDDPWGGHTLEWVTSSPPPALNFVAPLPPIRSYAPLLDLRHAAQDLVSDRERAPA